MNMGQEGPDKRVKGPLVPTGSKRAFLLGPIRLDKEILLTVIY